MSGFFFAFLATLIAGIGARDQLLVAALAARLGQRLSLLLVALASSAATAAASAWLASRMLPIMSPPAREMLAALALALAGAEMLLLAARPAPKEPTRSLGAAGLVLAALQVTDAARFLVFAFAIGSAAPLVAGIGGAAGGAVTVTLGWLVAGDAPPAGLSRARRGLGLLLLVVAVILALEVRGGV